MSKRTDARSKVQARINRIVGQVNGLQKMVSEDRYCVDVLTQVAAIRSALDALGVELLSTHLETCVAGCAGAHPESNKRTPEELSAEVRQLLGRFL
jgi:DNA-binding FrmR family transcriptional regulator